MSHGMSKTKFYKVWAFMKARCTNQGFERYSERGISVCEEWNNFEYFMKDMYDSYLEHSNKNEYTSLERLDNDKGYSKENCIWATRYEQNNNRSSNASFNYIDPDGNKGQSINYSLFAKENGLNKNCIRDCVRGKQKTHRGWIFYKEEA